MDLQNECESDIDKHRRIDFVAMLAFNQKRFDVALNLLRDNDYLPANNIKLLSMTELNDWKGAHNLLLNIETNGPVDKRYRISKEVVSYQQNPKQIIFSFIIIFNGMICS